MKAQDLKQWNRADIHLISLKQGGYPHIPDGYPPCVLYYWKYILISVYYGIRDKQGEFFCKILL